MDGAKLYIVPTPIGNLDDISKRAIDILSSVDIIACEDTRTTGKLLQLLNIQYDKLISYHEHNEKERTIELIKYLEPGKSIALVSDAGTPGISDPGYRIINAAIASGIHIIALPGPTALIPALLASGFPLHKFIFLGFVPQKKGRNKFINEFLTQPYTAILYESSHRIIKLFNELKEKANSERLFCIAKEISKVHEAYFRGTANQCYEFLQDKDKSKGEFVILAGPDSSE